MYLYVSQLLTNKMFPANKGCELMQHNRKIVDGYKEHGRSSGIQKNRPLESPNMQVNTYMYRPTYMHTGILAIYATGELHGNSNN